MIPVSAAFQAAVAGDNVAASLVQVTTPAGAVLTTLQAISGQVTADTTQVIRRSCTLRLTDPTGTLTAQAAGDLLTPYGNELRLSRGVQYADGTTELAPLGVFGIVKYDLKVGSSGLEINLDGQDRARKVARNQFTDVYSVAAGTNVVTAIQNIITSRLPATTFSSTPTSSTLPLTVYAAGADPWAESVTLAASVGMELFFDPSGVCVLRPVPDPTTYPVNWTFTDGASGQASGWERIFDDSATYNYVVVTGEHPNNTTAVSATASDTNASSPTYINGSYGTVTRLIVDRLITTTAQAQARATAELNRSIGIAEEVDGDTLVVPFLEPGDIAQITSGRAGINARYVLDALAIPLEPGTLMKVTARRRSS